MSILSRSVHQVSRILKFIPRRISLVRRVNHLRRDGISILNELASALSSSGCIYWVEYGTLLGLYRSGTLLKGDSDIDFGVLAPKDQNEVTLLINSLDARGIRLIGRTIGEQTKNIYKLKFLYRKTHVDISLFRECDQFFHTIINTPSGFKTRPYPKFTIVKTDFNGVAINAPSELPDHLSFHYGDTYLIPDQSWHQGKVKNLSPVNEPIKREIYN